MHVLAHSFDGRNIYNDRRAFFFEVNGLPEGQQTQIVKSYHRWRIRRSTGRVWSEWSGEYGSAEEVLTELSASLRHPNN